MEYQHIQACIPNYSGNSPWQYGTGHSETGQHGKHNTKAVTFTKCNQKSNEDVPCQNTKEPLPVRTVRKDLFESDNLFSSFCDSEDGEDLDIDMHAMTPESKEIEHMTTHDNHDHNSCVATNSLRLLGRNEKEEECNTADGIEKSKHDSDSNQNTIIDNSMMPSIDAVKQKITALAMNYNIQMVVFGFFTDDQKQCFSHSIGTEAIRFQQTPDCCRTFKLFSDMLTHSSTASPSKEGASVKEKTKKHIDGKLKHRDRKAKTEHTTKCDTFVKDKLTDGPSRMKHTPWKGAVNADKTDTQSGEREKIVNDQSAVVCEKKTLTASSGLDSFQNFHCKHCDYKTHFKKNLQEHELLHQKPSFKCELCTMAFSSTEELEWHVNFNHKCPNCDKTFSSLSEWKEHEHIHKLEKLICKVCNKKFKRLDILERHLSTHKGVKPFSCNTCNKSFARLDTLRKHELVHLSQRPHICDVCGKGLTRLEYLIAHKRIHTGYRPFMCENCGKQCYTAAHLRKHSKRCPANSLLKTDFTNVSSAVSIVSDSTSIAVKKSPSLATATSSAKSLSNPIDPATSKITQPPQISIEDEVLFADPVVELPSLTVTDVSDLFLATSSMPSLDVPRSVGQSSMLAQQQPCDSFMSTPQSFETASFMNPDFSSQHLFNHYFSTNL